VVQFAAGLLSSDFVTDVVPHA